MESKPEVSALFGEIDEVYKRIIKYELIIDSVRNVVAKGVLTEEDEEHVLMALNPTDIGQKEIDAIGLTDHKPEDFRLPAKHIPGLKELVKKDLDETIALVQELENATSFINNGDSDVVSQVAKLQKESADTSDKVHKLYKQLKTLLALHTTNRTSCMNKQVEALTLNASELAACSSESEDEVLKNIFHEATIDQLILIKEDLKKELAAVTLECHEKEKKLAKYAANEEQLLSLAATLEKLNEEIDLRTLAIKSLEDSYSNGTPRNSSSHT